MDASVLAEELALQALNKTPASTLRAYSLMYTASQMAAIYEENKAVASKYVHATSRGHEAIQVAAGLLLQPTDYVSPYYRDDAMLLAMGFTVTELMLQLMAKAGDPFSAGRTYYAHPSNRDGLRPTIPHQSSATGMQAIPATGMAHGLKYLRGQHLRPNGDDAIVLCSLGDGSMTEGEVAEAMQMAVLKDLPIIFLVQDNGWSISAHTTEFKNMDAFEYALGFKGLLRFRANGHSYEDCATVMTEAVNYVRDCKRPVLVHADCALIGHHTSGVRREWYRSDENIGSHTAKDPVTFLRSIILAEGIDLQKLEALESAIVIEVENAYKKALNSPNPDVSTVLDHVFAPTTATIEIGERQPVGGEKTIMVDAALHAIDEILKANPEALLYGQDVGGKLGGVFREAASLAGKYGDARVFNTPIQEAYIVGSTAGFSAVGAKPIVEIQFADYFWAGINQLVEELSKSCYLSAGKFPVGCVIRVPIGAYGGGGPYHSGSIESALLTIRGIKIAFPSNAADMKGLMKAAYLDPNPVIMLEHKGIYWSKVTGTEDAKCIEPSEDYVLPFGKANIVLNANEAAISDGDSCLVVTYGMGVYWAKSAAKDLSGRVEILDLRTLYPLDEEMVMARAKVHGKILVLTEEPLLNSFAESLANRISQSCFRYLDAPVATLGAASIPAIALNVDLEQAVLPSSAKVLNALIDLLDS